MSIVDVDPKVNEALRLADVCVMKRRPHAATDLDLDALFAEARIAALKSLETFQPDRNCKLSTWITHNVGFAIKQEMRRQDHLTRSMRDKVKLQREQGLPDADWHKPPLSLDQPIFDDGEEKALHEIVEDTRPIPEQSVVQAFYMEYLHQIVEQLRPEEQEVIRLKYWEGLPIQIMANRLGWTEKRIEHLLARARRNLKQWIEEDDLDVFSS